MDLELVELLKALGGAGLSLLLLLLSWGAKKAADKIKNEYASGLMLRMGDAVSHAVLSVKQSYVDALKDANGDGKLSKEEAAAAKAKAVEAAKTYLGKKGLKELGKILGAGALLDDLLGNEVEAQLGAIASEKSDR